MKYPMDKIEFALESRPLLQRLWQLGLNPMDVERKFFKKIRRLKGRDGCWIFTGAKAAHGYGQVSFTRPKIALRAHRLSYMLKFGDIPDGLLIMHSCDNPPCCNPAHLSLGTSLDNSRDAIKKGRMNFTGRRKQLTEKMIQEAIRLLKTTEISCAEVSKKSGVPLQRLYDVMRGKTGHSGSITRTFTKGWRRYIKRPFTKEIRNALQENNS